MVIFIVTFLHFKAGCNSPYLCQFRHETAVRLPTLKTAGGFPFSFNLQFVHYFSIQIQFSSLRDPHVSHDHHAQETSCHYMKQYD